MKSYTETRTPSLFSESIVSRKGGVKNSNGFYWIIGIMILTLIFLSV